MCESQRSSACFGLNWEGVNGSLLQKIFIIWGKYRKLQENFRFPWGIFSILIYAQDLSGLFGTHKSNAVDGCRQKQSIDWTEHISKQDNVSLDFCGKTDGGRLYLSSLLHIQHCTPFLRNQQSWRGVVSAPFCYHMTRAAKRTYVPIHNKTEEVKLTPAPKCLITLGRHERVGQCSRQFNCM